jgi:hypothetical protein
MCTRLKISENPRPEVSRAQRKQILGHRFAGWFAMGAHGESFCPFWFRVRVERRVCGGIRT